MLRRILVVYDLIVQTGDLVRRQHRPASTVVDTLYELLLGPIGADLCLVSLVSPKRTAEGLPIYPMNGLMQYSGRQSIRVALIPRIDDLVG
ncbi:MAG: hypothetical protein A2X36_03980 [Elusimicrobia bacterium GWA2_69_24]|nr:MAG: hypothetical protein A2X36_03980 [Elusimicrobia bacterium GWA2_69_24]HBL16064.1 hypothetical protein [Elusimicrobiota bacterium]